MKKKILYSVLIIVILLTTGLVGASVYFFHVAMVPSHKSFLSNQTKLLKSDPLYHEKKWYLDVHKQVWTMQSADGQYKLDANYIPASQRTTKTAIIAHGFMGSKATMGAEAYLFHHLGYNVLLPDARAQGQSQGKYIGYGWPERKDYVKWMHKIIQANGADSQIIMYGVSMGGAATMMTSGEKLPSQVKAFIEDCGYTNAKTEIAYQAKQQYGLPSFPLVDLVSGINRLQNGFFLGNASSIRQLHKNHRPMLFIHGGNDTFVPTSMVFKNYNATRGPKELWVVPKAGHAKSHASHPKEYTQKVATFLNRYVK